MMTDYDIVDRLENMKIKDDFGFIHNDVKEQTITEIQRLRSSLAEVLLDIKFMMEHDILPIDFLADNLLYKEALELMPRQFQKEFNYERYIGIAKGNTST